MRATAAARRNATCLPLDSVQAVKGTLVRASSLVADLACVVAALTLGELWSQHPPAAAGSVLLTAAARIALYCGIWLVVAYRLGTYLVPLGRGARRSTFAGLETWAVTWGLAGLVDVSVLHSRGLSVWTALFAGAILLVLLRLILVRTPLGISHGMLPRVVVVGACATARSLTLGRDARANMELLGVVPFPGEDPGSLPHLPVLGPLAELERTFVDSRADIVLVCPGDRAVLGDVHRVFRLCDDAGVSIQFFPPFLDLEHLRVSLTWMESRPGLAFHILPNRSFALLIKRAIDVAGALAGLILLLPMFVFCALAVKLSSRGPMLFRQTRVGKSGQLFTCYKFRTMTVGAEKLQEQLRHRSVQDGPAFKIPGDPRVTPVGRFLRKFSLDELPQIWNVLAGDMSLVGPRPPVPSEVRNYTWWQRRRVSVKPGLTCIWQVWGRNKVSFKRWVEMDLFYIDNWSLWLDLKLIAHTFRAVLRGTGM